jgi:hypothetical protein
MIATYPLRKTRSSGPPLDKSRQFRTRAFCPAGVIRLVQLELTLCACFFANKASTVCFKKLFVIKQLESAPTALKRCEISVS